MKTPLSGLTVIELASVLAGPAVGMFLAELGARVIKVEHHLNQGDVTRKWKLPSEATDTDRSAYFTSVNWGKASIGIDLRKPAGQAIVYDLIGKADIVLANYKPGDAQKLGMDAETLRAKRPGLIYADLTAYGPDDPRAGYDAIIQAEAGYYYMNGTPGGPPQKMPLAFMDLLAAHQLKEGILLALLQRERTGEGSHVQTSLIGAAIANLANQATNWLVGGTIPQRIGSEHPNIVPYGTTYTSRDGKAIVLAVGSDRQFEALCACLEAPELAQDARFAQNPDRVRNRAALHARIGARCALQDRDALLAALHAAKVPAGAVRDMAEVFADPSGQAQVLRGETMQGLRTVALEGVGAAELAEPPELGADTEAILADLLGYSAAQITALRAADTVA